MDELCVQISKQLSLEDNICPNEKIIYTEKLVCISFLKPKKYYSFAVVTFWTKISWCKQLSYADSGGLSSPSPPGYLLIRS